MFGRRRMTRQELMRSEFGNSMDHFRQAAIHAAGGIGATVGPMSVRAKDASVRARGMSGRAREMPGMARDLTTRARESGMTKEQLNAQISAARAMLAPAASRLSRSATMRARTGWDSSWNSTMAALAPYADAMRAGAIKASALEVKDAKNKDAKIKNAKKMRKMTDSQTSEGHNTRNVVALIACGAAVGAAGALVARRRNRAKWAEYEPSSLESDASSLLDPDTTATTSMSRGSSAIKKAGDVTKSAVGTVRDKIHDVRSSRGGADLGGTHDLGDAAKDDSRTAMKHASEKANEGSSHFSGNAEAKLSTDTDDIMRSRNGQR